MKINIILQFKVRYAITGLGINNFIQVNFSTFFVISRSGSMPSQSMQHSAHTILLRAIYNLMIVMMKTTILNHLVQCR